MTKSRERMDPEAFVGMDSRPGPSNYPPENRKALLPDHVKQAIEKRRGKQAA